MGSDREADRPEACLAPGAGWGEVGLDGAHSTPLSHGSDGTSCFWVPAVCPGPTLHLIYTQDRPDSDSPVKRRWPPCFTQQEVGSFPGPHSGTPDPHSSVGLYPMAVQLHPNPAPHAFAQCLFLFLASTAGHPQPATSGPRVKSELGSKEFESLSHRRLRRKNPHLNVILDSQI